MIHAFIPAVIVGARWLAQKLNNPSPEALDLPTGWFFAIYEYQIESFVREHPDALLFSRYREILIQRGQHDRLAADQETVSRLIRRHPGKVILAADFGK